MFEYDKSLHQTGQLLSDAVQPFFSGCLCGAPYADALTPSVSQEVSIEGSRTVAAAPSLPFASSLLSRHHPGLITSEAMGSVSRTDCLPP